MMNNEPVAWIKQNPETLQAELHFNKPAKYWATVISNPDIPLYTHPVKEQLTDEEIMDELVKVKHTWVATTSVWYEFEKEELKKAIRAILRNAQE